MSKKVITVILSLVLILGVGVYFSSAEVEEEVTENIYVGYSEADARGFVEASVKLEDGSIVDVELKEYNDLGIVKGEEYPWDEFHEAMDILPGRFEEADGYDVDTVSGATSTSNKAIEAVKMALEKAEGITSFDGTFMGISDDLEDRDGRGLAWVTIEEGKLIDIRLEEVSGDSYKDEDYPLDELMDAREELAKRVVEEGTYEVDSFTGATQSSGLWLEAVERALEKAGYEQPEQVE